MKKSFVIAALTIATMLLAGCDMLQQKIGGSAPATVQPTPMDPNDTDYNTIAKKVEDSVAHSGKAIQSGAVSFGPFATSFDGPYQFDPRLLENKVQALASKDGPKFNFATETISANKAAERYRVMDTQWSKESAVDAESLRTLGSLANVNYLFLARVSSKTAKSGDVTYTVSWKIGDCKTGLLVWTDETEITKAKPK